MRELVTRVPAHLVRYQPAVEQCRVLKETLLWLTLSGVHAEASASQEAVGALPLVCRGRGHLRGSTLTLASCAFCCKQQQ